MSLALQHRDRILAMQAASAPASGGGLAPSTPNRSAPVNQAAAQIRLRFIHDLRRLTEIKSTEAKIAAKRQMLPDYRSWCDGWLEASRMTVGNTLGTSGADDVLPTIMVWSIDTGDWARALELGEHVLRFGVATGMIAYRAAPAFVAGATTALGELPGLLRDRLIDLIPSKKEKK